MNTVCRTCLRSPNKLIPLSDQPELIHKIQTIASIEVTLNNSFPKNICEECVTNVKKFYNFRKVIINNNKDLEERLESANTKHVKENGSNSHVQPTSNGAKSEALIKKEKSDTNESDTVEHIIIEAAFNSSDLIGAAFSSDDSDDESITNNNEKNKSGNISGDENVEDTKKENEESNFDADVQRAIALLKIFPCRDCNKTFPSRWKLSNHRRTEHYAKSICSICGAIVRSDNIRKHIQMHSEGPAECKICGKVCKNSESLRGHKLIHRGEIFTCEICGKTSKVKADHHRHVKMHTNPEIGKSMCTLCGKKVRDMKKHMLSHTGERPYLCKYCNKGFTSPYSLKVHTRQHTNERPYMCDYCSAAFPQKVSLVTHIKSKHQFTIEVRKCEY